MTEPDLATAEQHLRHVGSKPMGLIVGALAQVVLAEYDRRADRDQLHNALTELRAASRGLAFFDQIKCARWNAAYQQASQVLGLEDDT